MAESTLTANQRQIQLEKQKLRLEQKRKTKQLQSDKVTINTVGGLRPSTSKSSRPSTGRSSRNSSNTTSTTTSPELIEQSSPEVENGEIDCIDHDEPKIQENGSSDTTVNLPIDVVKKLSELGISSTVAYDSDNSQESIDAFELDDELQQPSDNKPHPLNNEEESAVVVPFSSPSEATATNTTPSIDATPTATNSMPIIDATPTDNNNIPVSDDIKLQLPNEDFSNGDNIKTVANPLNAIVKGRTITNLEEIVFRPPPEGATVKCRITRNKIGMDKFMYPTYSLELEWDSHTNLFLLAAKKKKKSRSSYYIISTDPADLTKESPGFVAKLRSNFLGTSFVAYDSGNRPVTSPSRGIDPASYNVVREELVAIQYDTNILGFKGPRRMNIVIPSLVKTKERIQVRPSKSSETLLERLKVSDMKNLLQFYNKQPVWSEETQAYVLNFHGRVTEASVKNFQLVHSSDEDYVIVQFGRISEDIFTMDYSFPISAVQAFAVCLSSFDSKLACE